MRRILTVLFVMAALATPGQLRDEVTAYASSAGWTVQVDNQRDVLINFITAWDYAGHEVDTMIWTAKESYGDTSSAISTEDQNLVLYDSAGKLGGYVEIPYNRIPNPGSYIAEIAITDTSGFVSTVSLGNFKVNGVVYSPGDTASEYPELLLLSLLSDVCAADVNNAEVLTYLAASGCWTNAPAADVVIEIKEANVTAVALCDTVDFGAGFDVTSGPAGEANVTFDITEINSLLTTATAWAGDMTGSVGLTLTLAADSVDDTNIDWGTGTNQVYAADVPIFDGAGDFTATNVETALAELMDFNTADRSIYYVGPDGVGDDGADGLTEAACWATLAYAVATIAAGDVVEMLPGTHSTTNVTWTLPAGVTLRGHGTKSLIQLVNQDVGAVLTLNNNCTVEDLAFSTASVMDACYPIYALSKSGLTLRRLTMDTTAGIDQIYLTGCSDVLIEGCDLTSPYDSIALFGSCSNVSVLNTRVVATSAASSEAPQGIGIIGGSVTIVGCEFRVSATTGGQNCNARGIYIQGAASPTVRIVGCDIVASAADAGDNADGVYVTSAVTGGTVDIVGCNISVSGSGTLHSIREAGAATVTVAGSRYDATLTSGTITPGMPGDQLVAQSVANAALADNAVGADELAADAVVKASLAAGDFGDFTAAADGTCTIDSDAALSVQSVTASHTGFPVVDIQRTSDTNGGGTFSDLTGVGSGIRCNTLDSNSPALVDGYGGGFVFTFGDTNSNNQIAGRLYVRRDGNDMAGALQYFSGNTPLFIIRASGNVGIGTNAPAARLHVNGNIKAEGQFIPGTQDLAYSDGTNVVMNAASGSVGYLSATNTTHMGAISNAVKGATYLIHITQDGTGGRAVTWNAAYLWPGGVTPTCTTNANARDTITITAFETNSFHTVWQGDFQ